MTDRYGVIGHPIAHSKSPVIHRLFAEATGQDLSYDAIDIPPEQLASRVRQLFADGYRGLNVTVPHKTAVLKLTSRLTSRAELAGAVNTLIMHADGAVEGDNTDGAGLVNDLRQNLRTRLAGTRVLILGAGGATRGIIPALFDTNPRDIMIANRTLDRAQALASDFRMLGKILVCQFQELGGQRFDLVINATSAGLKGESPPFPGIDPRPGNPVLRPLLLHAGHPLRLLGKGERRRPGGPGLGHAGGAGGGIVLRLAGRTAGYPASHRQAAGIAGRHGHDEEAAGVNGDMPHFVAGITA